MDTNAAQVKHLEQLQMPAINTFSVAQRKDKLKLLLKNLKLHQQEILEALYKDLGKTEAEALATEWIAVRLELKAFIQNIDKWTRPKTVKNGLYFWGSKAQQLLEPMGRVLIITPWNYPLQLPLLHLIAAVAAGNNVVLKPSEFATATNKVLRSVLESVFDQQQVAVVEGDASLVTALMATTFHQVHFTGSTQVGKIIMENAAPQLMRTTLELGGKSPLVIDSDASIDNAIHHLLVGKFINAGQTCIAPDYVLVAAEKKEAFIKQFSSVLAQKFVKDTASNFLTKIVTERHFDRLEHMLSEAIANGAVVHFESFKEKSTLAMGPVLLANVSSTSKLMQEEIFGPILPVLTYSSHEEAIQIINTHTKPLAMYLFSENNSVIDFYKKHTTSGALVVNTVLVHIMHPNLHFGGVNHSGLGKSTGLFGLKEFSNEKPFLKINRTFNPIRFMDIPMSNAIVSLLKKLF